MQIRVPSIFKYTRLPPLQPWCEHNSLLGLPRNCFPRRSTSNISPCSLPPTSLQTGAALFACCSSFRRHQPSFPAWPAPATYPTTTLGRFGNRHLSPCLQPCVEGQSQDKRSRRPRPSDCRPFRPRTDRCVTMCNYIYVSSRCGRPSTGPRIRIGAGVSRPTPPLSPGFPLDIPRRSLTRGTEGVELPASLPPCRVVVFEVYRD